MMSQIIAEVVFRICRICKKGCSFKMAFLCKLSGHCEGLQPLFIKGDALSISLLVLIIMLYVDCIDIRGKAHD